VHSGRGVLVFLAAGFGLRFPESGIAVRSYCEPAGALSAVPCAGAYLLLFRRKILTAGLPLVFKNFIQEAAEAGGAGISAARVSAYGLRQFVGKIQRSQDGHT